MATEMPTIVPGMPPSSCRQQRGAVLYVVLVMLVLLALIGLAGMQVTGLQERMAANYRRANLAFENAESSVRLTESAIASTLANGGTYAADQQTCIDSFDPLHWADTVGKPAATHTRRVDTCFASSSRKLGKKQNEETGNIYQVTVVASDVTDDGNTSDATSSAVIDTVFIP